MRCAGFSLSHLLLLQSAGSSVQASVDAICGLSSCGSQALEHRLSSCVVHTGLVVLQHVGFSQTKDRTWSSALTVGFFIIEPPGEPPVPLFFKKTLDLIPGVSCLALMWATCSLGLRINFYPGTHCFPPLLELLCFLKSLSSF